MLILNYILKEIFVKTRTTPRHRLWRLEMFLKRERGKTEARCTSFRGRRRRWSVDRTWGTLWMWACRVLLFWRSRGRGRSLSNELRIWTCLKRRAMRIWSGRETKLRRCIMRSLKRRGKLTSQQGRWRREKMPLPQALSSTIKSKRSKTVSWRKITLKADQ